VTPAAGKRLLQSLLVPFVVLAVWEGLARAGILNPLILPSPSKVAVRWWLYLKPFRAYDAAQGSWLMWLVSGELLHDAAASLTRVFVGFLLGGSLGLGLGLLMGVSSTVYRLMNPLVQILRPIPPIAYIPLAILWFGLGNPPAFFLISLGAFFPILLNTIAGVRNVDSIYVRAAQNLGARGTIMFRRVILPAAAPHILTGVRVGYGVSFIVVIVAEMIAVNSGLGYRILEAREFFWPDKIVAGMITIGVIGLGIDTLLNKLSNHLLRWHRSLESS
jgi:NitT/TauT family transport system permease protein